MGSKKLKNAIGEDFSGICMKTDCCAYSCKWPNACSALDDIGGHGGIGCKFYKNRKEYVDQVNYLLHKGHIVEIPSWMKGAGK